MPSVSKNQQQASALALSAKRGEISPDKLYGAAKQMYESMSEEQLRHYAKTKIKGLPEKVAKERSFMKTPEIIKEALFIKISERGEGIGQGGERQLDFGADKCKCPKCGHVADHDKGIPCNTISCPECGNKMAGA